MAELSLSSIFLLLAVAVGSYLLWNGALLAFRMYHRDRLLSHIPSPPSRYPFSSLVDLITGAPIDTFMDWLNVEHHAFYPPSYALRIKNPLTDTIKPMVKIQFGTVCYVLVSSPSMIQRVLVNNRSNYPKDPEDFRIFMPLFGRGLLTAEGKEWEVHRSVIAPAFRDTILSDTANTSIDAVDQLSAKLLELLTKHATAAQPWHELEISQHFRMLTLQVIGHSVLSMTAAESDTVFPELYLPINDECNERLYKPYRAYLPTSTNWNFRTKLATLNSFLQDRVEQRLKQLQPLMKDTLGKHNFEKHGIPRSDYDDEWQIERDATFRQRLGRELDIMDRVILAALDTGIEINSDTVEVLRDHIKTFVFAGHETTAYMLTWAVHEALLQPHILQTIREEARQLWGDLSFDKDGNVQCSKPRPTYAEITNALPYTSATLKEVCRKYSVVPVIARVAATDDNLDGVHIPAGTKIGVLIKAVHYHTDYWERPLDFFPERFLSSYQRPSHLKHHPCQFLPFGMGARSCVGQFFSLLEARIVLSRLSLLFQLRNEKRKAENSIYHRFNMPTMPAAGMHVEYTHASHAK